MLKAGNHLLNETYTDEDDASLHEFRREPGPEPELADLRDRATDFLEQARGRRGRSRNERVGPAAIIEFLRSRDDACSRTPTSPGRTRRATST